MKKRGGSGSKEGIEVIDRPDGKKEVKVRQVDLAAAENKKEAVAANRSACEGLSGLALKGKVVLLSFVGENGSRVAPSDTMRDFAIGKLRGNCAGLFKPNLQRGGWEALSKKQETQFVPFEEGAAPVLEVFEEVPSEPEAYVKRLYIGSADASGVLTISLDLAPHSALIADLEREAAEKRERVAGKVVVLEARAGGELKSDHWKAVLRGFGAVLKAKLVLRKSSLGDGNYVVLFSTDERWNLDSRKILAELLAPVESANPQETSAAAEPAAEEVVAEEAPVAEAAEPEVVATDDGAQAPPDVAPPMDEVPAVVETSAAEATPAPTVKEADDGAQVPPDAPAQVVEVPAVEEVPGTQVPNAAELVVAEEPPLGLEELLPDALPAEEVALQAPTMPDAAVTAPDASVAEAAVTPPSGDGDAVQAADIQAAPEAPPAEPEVVGTAVLVEAPDVVAQAPAVELLEEMSPETGRAASQIEALPADPAPSDGAPPVASLAPASRSVPPHNGLKWWQIIPKLRRRMAKNLGLRE